MNSHKDKLQLTNNEIQQISATRNQALPNYFERNIKTFRDQFSPLMVKSIARYAARKNSP
jgi:hypothetical protein